MRMQRFETIGKWFSFATRSGGKVFFLLSFHRSRMRLPLFLALAAILFLPLKVIELVELFDKCGMLRLREPARFELSLHLRDGGKEGRREGEREGGRERGREGEREGERERRE